MPGFNAIGSFTLAALPSSGTTTVLIAATGAFALTGNADTFKITAPESVGAYTLTGNAAPLAQQLNAAAGAYTLTGMSDVFLVGMAEAAGSYTLTGKAAPLAQQINAATGIFALTGTSTSFQVQAPQSVGAYSLLGYPAITSLILVFSPSGELMIPTWEGRSIAVSDLTTMTVPAAPPSPAASTEYNTTMKPEKRTLEPGQ